MSGLLSVNFLSNEYDDDDDMMAEPISQKWKKYLLNAKTEFIPSSKMKCPKSGIFVNNYWVGLVGQVAVFSGTIEIFLGKDGSAP